jgi:hypothetical protein
MLREELIKRKREGKGSGEEKNRNNCEVGGLGQFKIDRMV